MAYARDDVTETMNGEMLAVLMERTCPKCNCAESRPVESDEGDHEVDSLPLRVCVECNELYGFDDSTSAPDHLHPHDQDETYGGHIWNDNDFDDDDDHGPLVPIPCFTEEYLNRPSREDQAVDQYHSRLLPRRGRGRGRRGHGGGCGHGRGRGHHHHHHHQWEDRSNNCHHHHHQRECQTGHGGYRDRRRGGAPLKQLADTCVQSGCNCAPGVATGLVTGDYGGALMSVSDEMEPIGRAVGSAMGSVAGNVLRSPQAADIAADMGSVVGRGMAEILKDSSLNNRRASSQYD